MEYIVIGTLFLVFFLYLVKFQWKKWQLRRAGKHGERDTYKQIKKMVHSRQGVIYRNLYLPLYERATEIDLLIVSKKGIVCIENKHVSGRISGHIEDKYWLQTKLSQKKKFYNPILQNEGHMKCLRYHLEKNGLKEIPIYSFIVFSNHNATVCLEDYRVGDIKGLKRFLKKYYFKLPNQMDVKAVIKIINRVKIK